VVFKKSLKFDEKAIIKTMNLDFKQIKLGFFEVNNISSSEDLSKLASSIGQIIPHPNGEKIYTLSPNTGEDAIKGTLSNRFGLSEFPLHSDTAFWSQPSRYIVMGMIKESSCDTQLISWNEIFSVLSPQAKNYAKNASYIIDTIDEKKYTSLFFSNNGERGLRFDPCCMKPANKAARKFHDEMLMIQQNLKPKKIIWSGKKAIVIDNWQYLHGRSIVSAHDKKRKLLRIYIR